MWGSSINLICPKEKKKVLLDNSFCDRRTDPVYWEPDSKTNLSSISIHIFIHSGTELCVVGLYSSKLLLLEESKVAAANGPRQTFLMAD